MGEGDVAGKGKGKDIKDVAADFFGEDDVDWLADEESEELAVAPPPPPPFEPPPDAALKGQLADEAAGPAQERPAEEPPTEAAEEPPTETSPRGLQTLGEHDLPTHDAITLELDPSSEEVKAHFEGGRVPIAPPPPPPPVAEAEASWDEIPHEAEASEELPHEVSEEITVFGDQLSDQDEGVPLVRTQDPAPARASVPIGPPSTSKAPSFSPPPDPPKRARRRLTGGKRRRSKGDPPSDPPSEEIARAPEPPSVPPQPEPVADAAAAEEQVESGRSSRPTPVKRLKWAPQDEGGAWVSMADTLAREGKTAVGETRAQILYHAGRLRLRRLGDPTGANYLQTAADAGPVPVDLHRELVDAAARSERWDEAALHLVRLGAACSGTAAAEALQQAATVTRQRLDDPETALARLQNAVELDPQDYASLSLLRDQLAELGQDEQRAQVLGQIAALASGRIAADAHWERGRLLQRLGRPAEAREALEAARALAPSHVPALLALEALHSSLEDEVGRAALYQREGEREQGAEAGWWRLEAARVLAAVDEVDAATATFDAAVAAGYPPAVRERQAWLVEQGAHEALAVALDDEARQLPEGAARAAALWRLGILRESTLGDADGALQAFLAACEADPSAAPAAEAAARLLAQAGRVPEALEVRARLGQAVEGEARLAALFRLAEVAEGAGDHARALEVWREVADTVRPGWPPATDALLRVARRLGRWEDQAAVHERRALVAENPHEAALHLLHAANGPASEALDAEKVKSLLERALDQVPALLPALEAAEHLLDAQGEHAVLVERLLAGAEATGDPVRQASLFHHAGQLLADRLGDPQAAAAALKKALEAWPGFPPSLVLLEELASADPELADLWRLRRERSDAVSGDLRAWWLAAAAEVAPAEQATRLLREGLDTVGPHPALEAAIELDGLLRGDSQGLLDLLRRQIKAAPDDQVGPLLARAVELHHEVEDLEGAHRAMRELARRDVPGRPLRAIARIAEGTQAWEEAALLLEASGAAEDRLHRARLLGLRLQEPASAIALYRELMDDPDWRVAAAAGAAGVAHRVGDMKTVLEANALLAEHAGTPAVEAAHSLWAAGMYLAEERADEALSCFRKVLTLRPGSHMAFVGAARLLVEAGDVEGLRALFTTRPEDKTGLAEALEEAGDEAGAASCWKELAEGDDLHARLRWERLLFRLEAWSELYGSLTTRRDRHTDPASVADVDARRRWLLAERMSETDEAWALYQQLHEEDPSDREVTEALARIAGARGETGMAIQYLRDLAESAPSSADAARCQRQIGVFYEGSGDLSGARQAFLDALDHLPDDAEALAGLKRLAEAESDWSGLVAVLQREAGLVEGERRLHVLREIARVNEEKINDPAVAMDAWRAVLDEDARDRDALTHLLALSEAQGEWAQMVEAAVQLGGLFEASERAELLRRAAVACADHLDRTEDAAQLFAQALEADPRDRESARRLDRICRSRADWAGSVRCLLLQADASNSEAEKVALLTEAAEIEAGPRNDRSAAARLHERALAMAPRHEPSLRYLAHHLFETERHEEVLPIFETLEPMMEAGDDVDDFDVRIELSTYFFRFAELLRGAERREEALARYERALELNPTHLPTLQAVGPLYTEMGNWKKAERVYRQLLQLTGGQGEKEQVAGTYVELGLVERALGNLDKAHKRFAKAREICPNHVGALQGLGLVHEDRKEWSEALHTYNNVISYATTPEDVVQAYLTKARILDRHKGLLEKAAQHYEKSLAFEIAQPVALCHLAELALRQESTEEALEHVERGLQLEGLEPEREALLHLLRAAALAGSDAQAATEAWQRAVEHDPAIREVTGDPPNFEDLAALVGERLAP